MRDRRTRLGWREIRGLGWTRDRQGVLGCTRNRGDWEGERQED